MGLYLFVYLIDMFFIGTNYECHLTGFTGCKININFRNSDITCERRNSSEPNLLANLLPTETVS